MSDLIICSQKISLRYFKAGDEVPIYQYCSDFEASLYLARAPHRCVEQTEKVLKTLSYQGSLSDNAKSILMIVLKDSQEPVGQLTIVQQGGNIELHIGILQQWWGNGVASEALNLAAQYYAAMPEVLTVVSFTDVEHEAALKAFQRAGFNIVCVKKAYYLAPLISDNRRDVYWLEYAEKLETK